MKNDAKFRAAKQGATYEEFQQIVKVHTYVCMYVLISFYSSTSPFPYFWATFYHGSNFDKNGLGYILGDF
jgi:hypothetical protein